MQTEPIKILPTGQEVGTAVIIHRPGGDVLTSVRTGTTSFARRFQFPGGSVQPEEESYVAAQREVFEEVGVHVELADRQPFMVTPGVKLRDGCKVHFVTEWFHAELPARTVLPVNPEPHKHTDWAWGNVVEFTRLPPYLVMPGSFHAVQFFIERLRPRP